MHFNIGLLNYGKNHNHDYFDQYCDHNYLKQLLIDFENITHLLNFQKKHLFLTVDILLCFIYYFTHNPKKKF